MGVLIIVAAGVLGWALAGIAFGVLVGRGIRLADELAAERTQSFLPAKPVIAPSRPTPAEMPR